MATADNDSPQRPSATPVPPRGGKKKAARPTAGRATGSSGGARDAGRNGAGGSRPSAAQRTANNRRAAVAAQRRRRNTLLAITSVGVVIIVVAVLIVVAVAGGGKHSSAIKTSSGHAGASGGKALPASGYATLNSPSVASLAAAAKNFHYSQLTYPTPISAKPLTKGGKPEVLYIGAEYCPYCATERWPLTIALSKFGTFSGLSQIRSNTSDAGIQHLATLSYYGSTYKSPYLTFTPVELENTQGQTLQKATAQELALANKYGVQNSIPFIDLGNKATITGAELDAHLLAPYNHAQILSQIKSGSSTLAANMYANAGAIISNLCQLTHGKPGNVCSAFPKAITS